MPNIVFIASSLDGYIADKNGGLEWLGIIPNPTGDDLGYGALLNRVDALVMGRSTFESVLGFGVGWPYEIPVFILSNTLEKVPDELSGKAEIVGGPLKVVIEQLKQRGYETLYIDGGKTIQGFLKEGLIDELIITTMPILLGGGSRLFGDLPKSINLELKSSRTFLNALLQNHYIIKR